MRLEVAPAEVAVVTGQSAFVVAQVFNTDDVINAYAVRVFGVDPAWVHLDDDRLSLFPGAIGTITVRIDVPPTYPAGELRVGVEVTPLVDPDARQIGESILVVPPVRRATLSLDPVTVAGGTKANFNITLGNQGNTPFWITLGATDPEDKVRVAFNPPTVELQPKQQVIVPARAVGKRPLIGNPAARILTFTASGADNPLESFASFVQRPRLGRGLLSLVGLLVAVSIFAIVLTNTLGRVVDVAKVDEKLLERAVNGASIGGLPADPGTASGTVTFLSSGAPAAGITVELFASDNASTAVASAATGANGSYAMKGLDEGTYKVRFRGAGFAEIWFGGALQFGDAKEVPIALGKTTDGLDMALGGIPGSISGKVLGTDPADAIVTLQLPAATLGSPADAQIAQVAVGADGAFVLEKVPAPASYELKVSKDGFATEKRVVNLAAAEELTGVEVSLRKGDGLISGLVTSGGTPLGGVTVTASNTTNESTTITLTSGNIGGYTLRNLPTPGTYTIGFAKDGYATENTTLTLAEGEQLQGMDMSMARGTGSISGTIRRAGTGPVGGVHVSVGVGDTVLKTESLSVGDVGTYLLTGLPVPGAYTVTFSGAGLATQVRSIDLDPRANANLTGLDATMSIATAEVTGTVRDEAGLAPGVAIVLTNGTDTWNTRSADVPAGTYRIRDVKPGTYTVTFSREGSVSRSVLVSLSAGDRRTVDVTLEPRATISGTVSRKTGRTTTAPLPGAFVVAYRTEQFPGTVAAQAITDAAGNYTLRNLSAEGSGTAYIIEYRPPDGAVAAATRNVTLNPGQQMKGVDVTLDLGGYPAETTTTTTPPQTAPPQTTPPQTAPPQTTPPQTAPPQTTTTTTTATTTTTTGATETSSPS